MPAQGWYLKSADPAEYREAIRQAELILDGRTKRELTESLTARMDEAAESLRFEATAEFRDRVRAIEGLSNRQPGHLHRFCRYRRRGLPGRSCFTVLHFINGDLAGKDFELIAEPLEGTMPGPCPIWCVNIMSTETPGPGPSACPAISRTENWPGC